jgi:hypothetical protein
VQRSQLAGLQIVAPVEFSAKGGVISDNTIGVNIQDPRLVIEDAFDEVRAHENDVDFDSADLPVPSAEGLLDAFEF